MRNVCLHLIHQQRQTAWLSASFESTSKTILLLFPFCIHKSAHREQKIPLEMHSKYSFIKVIIDTFYSNVCICFENASSKQTTSSSTKHRIREHFSAVYTRISNLIVIICLCNDEKWVKNVAVFSLCAFVDDIFYLAYVCVCAQVISDAAFWWLERLVSRNMKTLLKYLQSHDTYRSMASTAMTFAIDFLSRKPGNNEKWSWLSSKVLV